MLGCELWAVFKLRRADIQILCAPLLSKQGTAANNADMRGSGEAWEKRAAHPTIPAVKRPLLEAAPPWLQCTRCCRGAHVSPLPVPSPLARRPAPVREAYFGEDTPTGSAVREVVLYTLNLGAMEEPVAKIELLVQPEAKNRARVSIALPPK